MFCGQILSIHSEVSESYTTPTGLSTCRVTRPILRPKTRQKVLCWVYDRNGTTEGTLGFGPLQTEKRLQRIEKEKHRELESLYVGDNMDRVLVRVRPRTIDNHTWLFVNASWIIVLVSGSSTYLLAPQTPSPDSTLYVNTQ